MLVQGSSPAKPGPRIVVGNIDLTWPMVRPRPILHINMNIIFKIFLNMYLFMFMYMYCLC